MKEIWQNLEIFSSVSSAIIIAILASIARQAHHGWQGFRTFIRELIICAFVGMLLGWGLEDSGYSQGLQYAIIGGGSFSAGSLIEVVFKKIISLINDFNWKNFTSNKKDEI